MTSRHQATRLPPASTIVIRRCIAHASYPGRCLWWHQPELMFTLSPELYTSNNHYPKWEFREHGSTRPLHVSIISNLASNSCPQDVQRITSVSTLNSSERIP